MVERIDSILANKISKKNTPKLDIDKINEDLKNSQNNQLFFNNYTDFCNYLNIPIMNGNRKSAQLKNLQTMLSFETPIVDNNRYPSYVIKQAFYPLGDYDKKDLNQLTKYTILSYLLYQHTDNRNNCVISLNYLAEMLGYITLKYKYFYSHPKELASKTDIDVSTIYEFFEKTNDLYNRYILNSLDSLEKTKLIFYTKKYYGIEYVISNKGKETTYTTEYGDEEITFNPEVLKKCRELTNKEIEKLLEIETDVFLEVIGFDTTSENKNAFLNNLNEANISMLSYLFSRRLEKKYFALRRKRILEELNLSVAYQAYDIVYSYQRIFERFAYIYQNLNIPKYLYESSSFIINSSSSKLIDNTKKRHEREKLKLDENSSISLEEKERLKSLIDRETKEFKQVLHLLSYQQKNYQEEFKDYVGLDYIPEPIFNEFFKNNLSFIQQKNSNYKKRNKKLYASDKN